MYLIFDTETTGLPRHYNAPVSDTDNWPRMVQLAWQLHGPMGELIEAKNFIVRPEGYDIPFNAEKIHGISTERALREGADLSFVLGARINKYFGLEAFYQQTYEDSVTNEVDPHTLNADDEAYYLMNEYITSYKAYGLDLIGYIPLSRYFDLLGSVGVAKYEFTTEANFAIYQFDNMHLQEVLHKEYNDDNVGWRVAAGGQLNIADGVALRVMYRYAKIGGDVIDDMSEVSMGVRFLF